MKRALFLVSGICWILAALGFGLAVVAFTTEGAGLQFYGGLFSSGSVLLGLLHWVGLSIGALLCFAIGIGLAARGIARAGEDVER